MTRYIDADEALKAITYAELGKEYEAVAAIPTADVVERRTGEWLHKSKQLAPLNTLWWYECSSCGGHAFNGMTTNFCPHCGADMRGENNT